jgi:hypothetical protein
MLQLIHSLAHQSIQILVQSHIFKNRVFLPAQREPGRAQCNGTVQYIMDATVDGFSKAD